jgi:hypothetical protein
MCRHHDVHAPSQRRDARGSGRVALVAGHRPARHLGVQFVVKMGFKTVAIRGTDQVVVARKLGVCRYVDSQAQNAAEVITLGRATVILGIDDKMIILLAVSLRILPEPSPTVGESRERVPSEVQ